MGLISRIFSSPNNDCPENHEWRSVAIDKVRLARVMLVSAKTGVKPGTLINVGIELMLSAYDRGDINFETKNGENVKVIARRSHTSLNIKVDR